jgi:hypothetical protein
VNNLDLLNFINSRPHIKPPSSIPHYSTIYIYRGQCTKLRAAQATVILLPFIKLELRCNLCRCAQVVRFPPALKLTWGVFMLIISRLCRQIELKPHSWLIFVPAITQHSCYFKVLKLNCSHTWVWQFKVGVECSTCKRYKFMRILRSKDVCNFQQPIIHIRVQKTSIMIAWVIKDRFFRRGDWENSLCIAWFVKTDRRQFLVLTSFSFVCIHRGI